MRVVAHSAAVQDRDGARLVLYKIHRRFRWLELIWADGGYNAWQVDATVTTVLLFRMEIMRRSDAMKGFVVLSRRWRVERPFPGSDEIGLWPRTSRTLPKPWPPLVTLAFIQLALRRLPRAELAVGNTP